MDIGLIGLGRMGGNMGARLAAGGHRVVGFDPDPAAREAAGADRVEGVASVAELVAALAPPRAIWIMIPSGDALDRTLATLRPLLAAGDTVIDGGNTYYRDTIRRAAELARAGLHYIDAGTSGGIWGRSAGYSLMIGGDAPAVERLRPIFATLAPAPNAGWGRVGPSGAGHFVKMVHNAIEYGMMQAYAEGFALLEAKHELELDAGQIAAIWRSGSVVRSWLLDLIARALDENPELGGVAPYVEDSGEGRWAVAESIALAVPAPVITLALQARFRSRVDDSYADRLLAVMRQQFGGHAVKPG
ncbi:MAG TPA: decarboxylating 6-phosphogluconate dehydrogenase [Longimicrobiales bacterium]|nr:decarboxylating 6-phosphogluconate dehydrogenase [Longimicrobiales bacterium]